MKLARDSDSHIEPDSFVNLAIDSDSHLEPHSIFESVVVDSHSEPDSETHSIFEYDSRELIYFKRRMNK